VVSVLVAGTVNLILALTAGLIAIGIFRRVSGRLATSWRYLLGAFLILACAEVVGALSVVFQGYAVIRQATALLFQVGHFAFIVLAFLGLWHQFHLLKKLTGEGES
jgi:hypothetical protein